MTESDLSDLQPSPPADETSLPGQVSPEAPASTSLEAAIRTSLDSVDQELANLEAALKGEFNALSLSDQPQHELAGAAAESSPTAGSDAAAIAAREAQPESLTTGEPVATGDVEPPIPEAAETEASVPAPLTATAGPAAVTTATTDDGAALTGSEPALPLRTSWARGHLQFALHALALPLRAAAMVLRICDLPFARLRPGVKRVIGSAGIATCIVAAATWLAGDSLKSWAALRRQQPAPHTAAPTAPPSPSNPRSH